MLSSSNSVTHTLSPLTHCHSLARSLAHTLSHSLTRTPTLTSATVCTFGGDCAVKLSLPFLPGVTFEMTRMGCVRALKAILLPISTQVMRTLRTHIHTKTRTRTYAHNHKTQPKKHGYPYVSNRHINNTRTHRNSISSCWLVRTLIFISILARLLSLASMITVASMGSVCV